MENTWDFKGTKYGPAADRSRQALTLGWFLPDEHLSDDYTPLDKDADELFSMWLKKVDASGDIKIDWWIPELGELAPFQDAEGHDSFFDFYTWPTHSEYNVRLNWLLLPVQDKHWGQHGDNKGGFIQAVTGWKPSAFQRSVHLPTLLKSCGWPL